MGVTVFIPDVSIPVRAGMAKYGLSSATDCIAGINSAISDAFSLGRKLVELPADILDIDPSTTARIIAKTGVTLYGSPHGTKLRVKDNSGNYSTLIGGATDATRVTNFALRDLTIDQNPDGNTTSDIQTGGPASTALFCLYFLDFTDMTVDNVRFDPYVGGNCLMFNGSSAAAEDVRISNSFFRFERGAAASQPDYDNSTIYLTAKNGIVADNRFTVAIAERAQGAIEIHNPLASVTGNIIAGFATGVHVVAETSANDSLDDVLGDARSNVVVSANNIVDTCLAITVQASTGFVLRNVAVTDNVIAISQRDHDRQTFGGIVTGASVGAEGSYENLTISNNTIRFQYEVDAGRTATTVGHGAVTLTEAVNAGVSVLCAAGASVQGFEVCHNLIEAAPYMGILIGTSGGGTLRAGLVKDNLIINSGQNTGAVTTDFRAPIFAQNVVFESVTVEDNHHIDTDRADGTTPYGSRLWSFTAPAVGTVKLIVRRNESWVRSGTITQPSWHALVQRDEESAALNFPNVVANLTQDLTITVKGAAVGDIVTCAPDTALPAGLIPFSWVSAADTVTLRVFNVTGLDINPASQVWFVSVRKRQG